MATGDKLVNLNDLKAVHDYTQGQVSDLKIAFDDMTDAVSNDIFSQERMFKTATSDNFKLTGDGLCIYDVNYKMDKYLVTAGNTICINIFDANPIMYQFQSDASVPTSGTNTYLIGSPVTIDASRIAIVPDGATHLIVSRLVSANYGVTNVVYKTADAVGMIESDLYKNTDVAPYQVSENYRLSGNAGLCIMATDSKLVKYAVVEGQKLYLHLTNDAGGNTYQWQSNAFVSSSSNPYLIGSAVSVDADGVVTVPHGATFLIVSSLKTNTSNIVQLQTSRITELSEDVFTLFTLPVYATAENFKLTGTGLSIYDESAEIVKYMVKAGDVLYIRLSKDNAGVYQFQNATNVPLADNTSLIGDPVNDATDGYITVPDGATYLMVSQLKTNTSNIVKKRYKQGAISGLNPNLFVVNLIAHMGGDQGHDGTLSRLEYSYDHGYKILELDVQFTSDNVPVIQHNTTITVDGTTYTISSTTYATLSALDLGDGEHILTLKQALLFCKKRGLICEIDMSNHYMTLEKAKIIVDIVDTLKMFGSAIFTGVPDKINMIVSRTNESPVSVSNLNESVTTDYIDSVATYKAVSPCVVCSIGYTNVTAELVNYAHQKGLVVKTWTHTTQTTINDDLSIGVDLAIADNGIYPDNFVIDDD